MKLGLLRALRRKNYLTEKLAETIKNDYEERINSNSMTGNQSVIPLLFLYKVITPEKLADFAALLYGCPQLDLSEYKLDLLVKGIITEDQMIEYRVLPIFARNNQIYLAVSDPTFLEEYERLVFSSGYSIELVIVQYDILIQTLDAINRRAATIITELEKDEIFNPAQEIGDDGVSEEGPVAKFIDKIILDAVNSRASDIHFEFYEGFSRIRYRMDGVLKEIVRPPLITKDKIASRIKIMSNMDISEKRVPQDGSMKLVVGKRVSVDFRVSTLPTVYGEKIVLRILDSSVGLLDIEKIGMNDREKNLLLNAIDRPYGMILVTGPTGSGKTVSLYNCISILNKEDVNISTIEDPVEINLLGINQVSINERQGLSFAVALKAFLRQDPDVIMLGEIRDYETADIALKASQTGHLVFSTLHTNNAAASLTRLVNMGVEPFLVASSVCLIIAQRLVRILCPECKKTVKHPPKEILLEMGFREEDFNDEWRMYGPVGCRKCKNTGYKGRTGIFEMLSVSDEIQAAIVKEKDEKSIESIAYEEGMISLRRSGILKVISGLTSLDEVLSTTN